MKKSKIILLTLTLTILAMAICACSLLPAADSITIVKYPATSYVQGAKLNYDDITVKLNDGNEITLTKAIAAGVVVKNFSTEKVGSFTAIIEYQGYQVIFNYSVVPKTNDFAGGNGTESDPYLVSTKEHWNLIGTDAYVNNGYYFELINDIDMQNFEINPIGYTTKNIETSVMASIHLNGNGYSVKNIDKMDNSKCSKYTGLMCLKGGSTIENVKFYFTSDSDSSVTSISYTTYPIENTEINFNNVEAYGYINTMKSFVSNAGVFIGDMNQLIPAMKTSYPTNFTINFVGCKNYANVIGGNASTASGFIALINNNDPTTIKFNECINYADIDGAQDKAAGFIASMPETTAVSFIDCENSGTIVKLGEAYQGTRLTTNDIIKESGKINSGIALIKSNESKINEFEFKHNEGYTYKIVASYGLTRNGTNSGSAERMKIDVTTNGNTHSFTLIENYDLSKDKYEISDDGKTLIINESLFDKSKIENQKIKITYYAYAYNGTTLIGFGKLGEKEITIKNA